MSANICAHLRKNSIMRKISVLICAILCLFNLTGCEAFRKKFVRKPKIKEVKVVVHTYEYESEYSLEKAYKKYYSFWRGAHEELISLLNARDENRKRRVFAAEKVVEALLQMQELLLPPKQTRLDDLIIAQKDIVRELDRYNLTLSQKLNILGTLQGLRRQIQKEFRYKEIQGFLVKE